jgi:hypothetical protein
VELEDLASMDTVPKLRETAERLLNRQPPRGRAAEVLVRNLEMDAKLTLCPGLLGNLLVIFETVPYPQRTHKRWWRGRVGSSRTGSTGPWSSCYGGSTPSRPGHKRREYLLMIVSLV